MISLASGRRIEAIAISELDLLSPIRPVGVEENGELEVPDETEVGPLAVLRFAPEGEVRAALAALDDAVDDRPARGHSRTRIWWQSPLISIASWAAGSQDPDMAGTS